jgi:hypothetical protein
MDGLPAAAGLRTIVTRGQSTRPSSSSGAEAERLHQDEQGQEQHASYRDDSNQADQSRMTSTFSSCCV